MSRPLNIQCLAIKSRCSDWWTIERAVHNNERWEERVMCESGYNVTYHRYSGRLDPDACVEGTGYEMQALATAILAGRNEEFNRCGIKFTKSGSVMFYSPRNSHGRAPYISRHRAIELAKHIQNTVSW